MIGGIMENVFEFSVAQKEKFRIAANKLLNQCFLLKRKEDTKKEYMFVREFREEFRNCFDLLGYELLINEDQGVIGIRNIYGTGRIAIKKINSIMLLILRLLYVEKRREISNSYDEVTVLMEEIKAKYSMLKIRPKENMDKGMEREMVSLFKRYNLIQNLDSDVTMDDARIVIYPSILFALPVENIEEYYKMNEEKLKEYSLAGSEEDQSVD